ncbi:MAG: hypothetical protein ACI97A_003927 [Planctomycetota bacterium]|jgi:hypothetical protein
MNVVEQNVILEKSDLGMINSLPDDLVYQCNEVDRGIFSAFRKTVDKPTISQPSRPFDLQTGEFTAFEPPKRRARYCPLTAIKRPSFNVR